MQNFGNVLMIGTGLMTGSLAKALKERGLANKVAGFARRLAPLELGVSLGILDEAVSDLAQAISAADIIVLGVPTLAVSDYLCLIEQHRKKSAAVTDVASVKGDVVNKIRQQLGHVPDWFIAGHPIAGAEKSGIEAANAALYVDHKVILTPEPDSDKHALATITALWQAVGAEVVLMEVAEHDRVLAATSHLPHVLAFSLVDTLITMEQKQKVFDFAAGGFRDFSRIAASDPVMWHDIMLANKAAILASLQAFKSHLDDVQQLIETEDSDGLLQVFSRAKKARDEFGQNFNR